MRRHGSPNFKENTPPGKSLAAPLKSPAGKCKRRLPLGTIRVSNTILVDKTKTPEKPQIYPAPPAALPSTSPEMTRRKGGSREGMPVVADGGCFGIGPTVQGSVKDRRKSKPRALLTVEPLPNVATLVWDDDHDKVQILPDIPGPGRASLEWISEPESDFGTSDSLSSTDTMDTNSDHPNLSDLMSRIKLGSSKPASHFYSQILGVPLDGTGQEENVSRKKICHRAGLLRCTGKVVPTKDTWNISAKHKTPPVESQGRHKRQCKANIQGPSDTRQQVNLSQFLKASRDLSQQQAKFFNSSMLGFSGFNRKNANL